MRVYMYSRSNAYWKGQAVEEWTAGTVNMDGEEITQLSNDDTTDSTGDSFVATGGRDCHDLSSAVPSLPTSAASAVPLSEKEIKKIAFSICNRRYTAVLPIVSRLAELEESMLGDDGGRDRGTGRKTSKRR